MGKNQRGRDGCGAATVLQPPRAVAALENLKSPMSPARPARGMPFPGGERLVGAVLRAPGTERLVGTVPSSF